MMKGGLIMDKIKILKALSDNTRLSILNLLNGEKLCVCEIEAILDNTQSNISRHLAKLKEADLILSTKYAQWVHYELNYELPYATSSMYSIDEVYVSYTVSYHQ